ncbi:MAG: NIPSNAP family protein [Candidatus Hydrogenedentota bacterium]
MKRRQFLAATSAAGLGAMVQGAGAQAADNADAGGKRDVYELRQYHLATEAQQARLDSFLEAAMVPALNRLGIEPVGVFHPEEGFSPTFVLLRHPDMASAATLTNRLLADDAFLTAGADFLNTPADDPAYARMAVSLFKAFAGMPRLERPVTSEGRVLQLRTYESPSVKTGQKKIEMFNIGEIDIFRASGLHPVFFGEALAGECMPNLTYMLAFKNQAERKANWKTFVNSDAWKELSSKPEYADDKILSNITNIFLKPAPCSQV